MRLNLEGNGAPSIDKDYMAPIRLPRTPRDETLAGMALLTEIPGWVICPRHVGLSPRYKVPPPSVEPVQLSRHMACHRECL